MPPRGPAAISSWQQRRHRDAREVYSGSQLAVQGREGMLTQSGTLAAAGNVQLNAARGIQSSGHLLAGSDAESTGP